jgi:hypothetical protein
MHKTLPSTNEPQEIAILDFETDPFDAPNNQHVLPFVAVLYFGTNMQPLVIWDNDYNRLCEALLQVIEELPGRYVIYAHNGGRFDYYFLVSKFRGRCNFKGRALMSVRIGRHELRDSLHIIPERLGNIQKDDFDYKKMHRKRRDKFRDEIIRYCLRDCIFLYTIVREFWEKFDQKISIGQAALSKLKEKYTYEKLSKETDKYLRPFFFGGRVECFRGRGIWKGDFRLYDVNSMYPHAMAAYEHPTGQISRIRTDGKVRDDTVFIELTCNSRGAFLYRDEEGKVNAPHGKRRFHTTIHEYDCAIRNGLISDIEIHRTVDFERRNNFAEFIVPLYYERQLTKEQLDTTPKHSEAWYALKRIDIFIKLLLNNSYGKFAQNPDSFKERFLTEPFCAYPPDEALPTQQDLDLYAQTGTRKYWGIRDPLSKSGYSADIKEKDFWIWERSAPRAGQMYNNVATGASITGAARAVLLDAMCKAYKLYYCDTDSLICEGLDGVEIHPSKLGAWDCEARFHELAIAGKKQYAYRGRAKDCMCSDCARSRKIRQKGAVGLTFDDMCAMVKGETITKFAGRAPLIKLSGEQVYIQRELRATAPLIDFGADFNEQQFTGELRISNI